MKLFGFNISRSQQVPQTKSVPTESELWLTGGDSGCGGLTLSNAYQQVVWVYRAINVLAEQIGNIPFLLSSGERGRENLITRGPLVNFYNYPHPQIDRFQYWELRIIWLMLRGECFRIPIYSDSPSSSSSTRRLQSVLISDPSCFQHIVDDHQLIGWRYTGFGASTPLASQVFLPEEVWFEKLPNPFNFWRGLAPLRVAGLAAETDFAAGAFMKGVMENNGDLGLIVRAQEQLGPDQREQLHAALRQRRRRAGTANEPLLLWNTTEIVQPQLSSSDLQFLENRRFSRAEICAAFGVPEEIVTTTDNAKYDVMDGARLNFIEHRIAPLCRRLEAGEDVTVKSLDPGAVGWFDLESLPILQKAQRDRMATARSVFDMGVPFNELNRVLDLGFRRLPWGDRGYVASKLTEVGEDSPKSKAQSPKSEADGAVDLMWRLLEEVKPLLTNSEELAGNETTPCPIDCDAWDPRLRSKARRFLFEQRGRALARIGQCGPALPAEPLDQANEAAHVASINLPPETSDAEAKQFRELLLEQVRTIHGLLSASLAAGVAAHETSEHLAERIRSIYNDAARAEAAPIRRAIVPAQSPTTNE